MSLRSSCARMLFPIYESERSVPLDFLCCVKARSVTSKMKREVSVNRSIIAKANDVILLCLINYE